MKWLSRGKPLFFAGLSGSLTHVPEIATVGSALTIMMKAQWWTLWALAVLAGRLLWLGLAVAQAQPKQQAGIEAQPLAAFGVNNIAYGNAPPAPSRYNRATQAGVQWHRWVLYWTDIEKPGGFDYSLQDPVVIADVGSGLSTDAVLLLTPDTYATGGNLQVAQPRLEDKAAAKAFLEALAQGGEVRMSSSISPPRNLYTPVFADGTDSWAPGKAINSQNYWARFVNTTVLRYKPGGVLAQQRGWGPNQGLRTWEMWNEPDFSWFWSGSVADYVRLLKVGYLAAKAADPQAQVLVGGMMYWEWTNRTGIPYAWLRAFLDELKKDAAAPVNEYYFHAIPWHWYSRSSDLYQKSVGIQAILAQYGLSGKGIWVNETNLPVCGDPPGPSTCTTDQWLGTIAEQASFILQAHSYALAGGVSRVITFQLYDDNVGPGQAYGLIRNNDQPRPAYTAFQVVMKYLSAAASAWKGSAGPSGQVDTVTMRTTDGRRVVALWNTSGAPVTVDVPAYAKAATLVSQDGTESPISRTQGFTYHLTLPAATRYYQPDPRFPPDYFVGGLTYLIVEPPGTTVDVFLPIGLKHT
ncbi:MAG: hypothetical protein HYX89_07680 [Chloroflexi bacterium]|nr:hypothetical protein [Chloroflexota bacterium]